MIVDGDSLEILEGTKDGTILGKTDGIVVG